jgi:hypothetical protein
MGELTDVALAWLDRYWDPSTALLWNMDGSYSELGPPRSMHLVPQSAWYAAGLLARDGPGDDERAARTIEALLECQYHEAGTPWHGTFSRFLETPPPKPGAVLWVDYDPNWRQFVGTAFAFLLQPGAPGTALHRGLRRRMHDAVSLAMQGEPLDRVTASYSNIALMRAWLEVEQGRDGAEAFAQSVVDAFDSHGTFEEYNSPTYYGVDLYALALWRSASSSSVLRDAGARIEAALWRDVARWYHPELQNLCGPWSRSYGMDMTKYVSLLGLWMVPMLGFDRAPFPSPDGPLDHSHDFSMAPMVELLRVQVPADTVDALGEFVGAHEVQQTVTTEPPRRATGWLGDTAMCGGEDGEIRANAFGQFHPANAHWQAADGDVAWLRLVHNGPARAVAGAGRLDISCLPHRRRGPQAPRLHLRLGEGGSLPALSVEPERIVKNDDGVTVARFPVGTERIVVELG